MRVTYIDHMGSDLTVVNAARVSFGKKVDEFREQDAKLINYLAKHKHTSPFGHCFMSFHVKAPIFVARQLVKHKFLRWNEVSRRYVDDEPEFYYPEVWRNRAENVKQGSGDKELIWEDINFKEVIFSDGTDSSLLFYDKDFAKYNIGLYKHLLEKGVAPEQARMVLPQNTYTEWYWSGSLDAFADMCRLRLDPHAQYETRIIAEQIDEIASNLYPVSWKALLQE